MARWVDNVYSAPALQDCEAVLYARLWGTGIPHRLQIKRILAHESSYRFALWLRRVDVRLDGWLFLLACFRDLRTHDVVHVHGRPHYPMILRRLGFRGAIVLHIHRDWSRVSGSFISGFADVCDRVVFVSCSQRDALLSINPSVGTKATVIYNGADPETFHPRPSSKAESTILFVGNMTSEKGLSLLLDAYELLSRDMPEAKLRIVAREDRSAVAKKLRAKIEELIRAGFDVKFLGEVTHERGLPNLVAQCSVLCVPSVCEEAFPLVIIEAMLSKTVVVGTRSGGIPEALGACGIVAEKFATTLAFALKEVLQDSKRRIDLEEAAYARAVQHFTWETVARRTRATLAEACETASRRHSMGRGV